MIKMYSDPWEHISEESLIHLNELQKELPPNHPLNGIKLLPVAKRVDRDEVCFREVNSETQRYFEVHLTWSGKQETNPFPTTKPYDDFQSWFMEKCLEDQRNWTEGKS